MYEIKRTHIHQIEQQGPILPEGVVITTSTNSGDEYTAVSVTEHAPDSITIRGCPPECGESLRTRITKLERERDEARAEARVWKNRTRCLFTKYCSRTFDCPTESYLERTIVKLDEEIAAVDKET